HAVNFTNVVTDANGCTSMCQARLIVNPNPICSIAPMTNTVCVGSPASFTVTGFGGTPPYSVVWTGPNGFSSTNLTITIPSAALVNGGVYVVVITHSKGCANTCQARLIVNSNPICTITPQTNAVCLGATATFTANGSGGTAPYTFKWSGPGGFTSTSQSIT